jgi:acetylornithine/succinyldiaminopimelate/putrescine aminotransferase
VLRFLPPLLIEEELLRDGFRRVDEASDSVVEKGQKILIGEG